MIAGDSLVSAASAGEGAAAPHVELVGLRREYEGNVAVDDVSLAIARGTVHSLVGENGAGKSTIGKMIAGVVRPSGGELRLDGQPVDFHGARDALAAGVALVHQELALAPSLSVEDNIFLGSEVSRFFTVRRRETRARVTALMERTGLVLDPAARVGDLRVAERQIVEILRAVASGARLIVMDEPTAPLAATEVDRLMEVIKGLRDQGTTVVYISHQLDEVLALSDDVSVIKDGNHVLTRPARGATASELITAMLGQPLDSAFPEKRRPVADAPVVLDVRNLCRRGVLEDISFTISAGEILGFAGLVGSGRSELARAIFGADPVHAGTVTLDGRAVRFRSPADAARSGVAFLPEDRKDHGLVLNLGVRQNLTLPALGAFARAGVIDGDRERSGAQALADVVGVRGGGLEHAVSSLSGGNQQKVALGKWLHDPPSLFLIDEPTRGVDIGAKRAIYDLIFRLADQGMAVLLISSDLIEVQGLADRIAVMRGGRLAAMFEPEASQAEILSAAFGQHQPTKES